MAARRPSSGRSRSRGFSASGRRLTDLAESTRRAINNAARNAAVEIMNDLAEAGPVYSGQFRDSWLAIPVGRGASGSAGGGYPYTLSQVPQLSITNARELGRAIKFTIENSSPHAGVALDLEQGFFVSQEFAPEGNIVARGSRTNPGIRGDVTEGGNRADGTPGEAISTAELDWYETYVNGGGLQKALEGGVRLGFALDRS